MPSFANSTAPIAHRPNQYPLRAFNDVRSADAETNVANCLATEALF
jgi:hypothetical protein